MKEIELIPYDLESSVESLELLEIIEKYYSKSPYLPDQKKIQSGEVVYYRAFLSGSQVGITGYSKKTPTLAETIKTTIFDDFRGKGLGTSLSQAIEDECKKLGIKKILSTVYFFNHAMIHIKMKQGYTIEGYHPDHEAPGFHEYSLGKFLT